MVGRSLARARMDRDLDVPLSSLTRLKPGKEHFQTTSAGMAKQKCQRSSLVAHWLLVSGDFNSDPEVEKFSSFIFKL